MLTTQGERAVPKEQVLQDIQASTSALQRYGNFYVGSSDLRAILRYEMAASLLSWLPGALGLGLRKAVYPSIFRSMGADVMWGRNIVLRHPNKISVGSQVAIDDNCLLDAKGGGEAGIVIGNHVLVARSTIIQCKGGTISIGDHATIGSQTQIASVGGIFIGSHVLISGQCYFGGGRYNTDDADTPIVKQGLYSKGATVIEDDVWLGAGALIQDGVHIGHGSVIGAGAVIREDIPAQTVVVPNQRLVMLPREKGD
ncbi:MAG: acyltransferase [Anaerolineae bacterium]|nr:acyltransferase [Anaerolineae bacterium]